MTIVHRILGALLVSLLACADDPAEDSPNAEQDAGMPDVPDVPDVPDAWIEHTTECDWSFRAPAELVVKPAQGTDSCVSRFETLGCKFGGDFGGFSNPLLDEDEPDYMRSETTIDGVPARIVSFGPGGAWGSHVTGVHLPADTAATGPKLTLTADCASDEDVRDAQVLFRTIRLPR